MLALLTLAFFLTTIVSTGMWITTREELKAQKLLNSNATPVKELAADFRSFVESVDGKVSPEVDEAIKQLEGSIEIKSSSLLVDKKLAIKPRRSIIMGPVYDLFMNEFVAGEDDWERYTIIERWGKKWLFPLKRQVELVIYFDDADYREDLREYFDKHHQTNVIT